ncbi:hypothetical protein C8R46DRAFT_1345832 [Mycena filopes]|nr:hypothetical protein C8R46DRAFT_1345832 [Mycena filopes]
MHMPSMPASTLKRKHSSSSFKLQQILLSQCHTPPAPVLSLPVTPQQILLPAPPIPNPILLPTLPPKLRLIAASTSTAELLMPTRIIWGKAKAHTTYPPIAFLREPTASPTVSAPMPLARKRSGASKRVQTQIAARPQTPTPTQIPAPAPVFQFAFHAPPQPPSSPPQSPSKFKRNALVPRSARLESRAQTPHAHPRAAHTAERRRGPREHLYADEHVPADVGVLQGGEEPRLGLESAVAWAGRVRAAEMGMDVEVDTTTRSVYEARRNTAPTEDYIALLEETFGPGSVLRGEGAKPGKRGGRGRSKGAGRGRGSSVGTSASGGTRAASVNVSEMEVDVEVDVVPMDVDGPPVGSENGNFSAVDEEDAEVQASRACMWIAELQVLVKGKRKMTREDMKSLVRTMREIKEVDAAEVKVCRALLTASAMIAHSSFFHRRMGHASGNVCGKFRNWRISRLAMNISCARRRGRC